MTAIRITRHGDQLSCVSPYNAEFVTAARQLAGKWRASAWWFPATQEERLRRLCREVYGTDGSPVERVTLRVSLPDGLRAQTASISIAGRMVARAQGRDTGAQLGDGVVITAGAVASGGSRQYWETIIEPETELEILDVPRPMAEKLHAQGPGEPPPSLVWAPAWEAMRFAILQPPLPEEELASEREDLLRQRTEIDQRLAEIDQALHAAAGEAANPVQHPAAGGGALHEPAYLGETARITMLVAHGADPDARDERGRTALHRAVAGAGMGGGRHAEAVSTLIELGADPDARDELGNSPLHYAAWNANPEIIRRLTLAGANVHGSDNKGQTALHIVAFMLEEIPAALTQAGANVQAIDEEGATPLHLAVRSGNSQMAEALTGLGADPDARDEDGHSSVDLARARAEPELAAMLVAAACQQAAEPDPAPEAAPAPG